MLSKSIEKYNEYQKKNFQNLYDVRNLNYSKEKFVPKNDLYQSYFTQNKKKMPQKFLLNSVLSYAGGCVMGFAFMMLSFMGTSYQNPIEEQNTKYTSFSDLRKQTLTFVKNSVHRNGMFMIRITIAIGVFNTLVAFVMLFYFNNS
jgi:hypothetical protein